MIIHDVRQGTTEWLELRAGIPTASCFDQILTPGGKPSKSAERYMFTLLAEKLMGHPAVEHGSTSWMQRGTDLEAAAVAYYEFEADADTVAVGFVTNDEGTIGASPDRMVGETGLLEIKCPSEWIQMGYLLESGSAYEAYKVQCQGQLWITGRQWVDVLAWHPELPPALHRIERDEPYIKLLTAAVEAFSVELEKMAADVAGRGWMCRPTAPRTPTAAEIMREALLDVKNERVTV